MSPAASFAARAAQSGPLACVAQVDYAYQPIVSTSSLRTHGFEALARFPADCGCVDIAELLDDLASNSLILKAERLLLTAAANKYARFEGAAATRLFCNIDNRVFDHPNASPHHVVATAANLGLEPANICIELTESRAPRSTAMMTRIVDMFLDHNVRIAIDDFGQGYSGLDTLMRIQPHYIKIDRAFIDGLAESVRQQAIVSKMAGLAHSLGAMVVAEGVETEADFRAARDLGCDLAQGYLIARPTQALLELKLSYDGVCSARPEARGLPQELAELITYVEPLRPDQPLIEAVKRFQQLDDCGSLPVTDEHGYVHGALYERDVRQYLFGEFGSALLANKCFQPTVAGYLRRCPISDGLAGTGAIVEGYVVTGGNQGVILTVDGTYAGVLSNQALLRLAADREVAAARDQNPLTLLPGNNSISRHLNELTKCGGERTLVFLDFDNFKTFNDEYGFTIGDRALTMFAQLLMKFRHNYDAFVAHIGGDDFFLSMGRGLDRTEQFVSLLIERFARDAESLHTPDDRERGGILARDRYGVERLLPLLSASAGLLALPIDRSHLTESAMVAHLNQTKSAAKRSDGGLATAWLPDVAAAEHRTRLTASR